jgi:N-methylhydantoinase A/oxoprolinase/acetone carboxylase beta subunit
MAGCPEPERRAWERLADGPVELDALVRGDRELARGIARLQHKGLAIYTGFTPTDAAHAVGLSTHWSTTAASLAARLWARQMRHQFGFGGWGPDDAVSPSREVLAMVGQRIGRALIEAGLHQHRRLDSALASGLSGLLADLVVESARAPGRLLDSGALFHLKFAADYPVVAVGAPASTFFPDAVGDLGADLHLPGAAEVANAFGAVMGSIVQRAVVTVTQPSHGNFTVHSDLGPLPFADLEQAIARAREIAAAKAREGASTAGADAVELRLDSEARHVRHDLDGELFLETRVIATATGVPVRK